MNIELTVLPRPASGWNVVSCCSRWCIVRLESVRAHKLYVLRVVARRFIYLFSYLSFRNDGRAIERKKKEETKRIKEKVDNE